MKFLLRSYLISLFSLFAATNIISSFSYNHKAETLLMGALVFLIINWFVKPVLKLFTLPLTLISLGMFSWVVNILVLYLLILVVSGISLTPWNFSGFSYESYTLPAFNFNLLLTYLVASFIISLINTFLNWLYK